MFNSNSEEPLSVEEAQKEFNKLHSNIKSLLFKLGFESKNIQAQKENLDDIFMKTQYQFIADNLRYIEQQLDYLSRPVLDQGILILNNQGRYELPNGRYLTSGSVCEILYVDDYGQRHWILTTIEHEDRYYATSLGSNVDINNMVARVR